MMTARWTGMEEATRNISALGHELATSEVIEKAIMKVAQPLKAEIVRTAPRSQIAPHMADTFIVKVSREEREWGRTTVLIGPRAGKGSVGFVARFIEFGTSKMKATPFIRPAFDAFKGGYLSALVVELQRQFERVIRKYSKR